MPTESFRELNRLRRQQNAFAHLREYARARGLADADEAARRAAETIHGGGGASTVGQPEGTQSRSAGRAGGAAREAAAKPAAATAPPAESAAAAPAGESQEDVPEGAEQSKERSTGSASREADDTEAAPSVPHRLEDRTKEQLYTRAQELEIEGRSQMTKEELIEAIRAAQ